MAIPSMEAFKSTVAERMEPGFRYHDPTNLERKIHMTGFDIRLQGAYITGCFLRNDIDPPTEVLYTPPDLSLAKLDASHAMSPVGRSMGLGGQHGIPRWADYEVENMEAWPASVFLLASTPEDLPSFRRVVALDGKRLTIATELHNTTSDDLETSLGEHLYFSLPGGNAKGLRIGTSIETLEEPTCLDEIMQGKAQFWPDFKGSAVVDFPDGKRLSIESAIIGRGDRHRYQNVPLGMLLWHRIGTESICIEPTLGYADDGKEGMKNDLLKLSAGGAVALETNIQLMS